MTVWATCQFSVVNANDLESREGLDRPGTVFTLLSAVGTIVIEGRYLYRHVPGGLGSQRHNVGRRIALLDHQVQEADRYTPRGGELPRSATVTTDSSAGAPS